MFGIGRRSLVVLVALLFVGGMRVELPTPAQVFGGKAVGEGTLSAHEAVEVARREIADGTRGEGIAGWSESARVAEARPVYADGRDGVAYWECAVEDGGRGAGYVLVNADRTDLIVPESSAELPPLHRSYRDELGHENFEVVRYDWFRSVAVRPADAGSGGRGTVLASRGMGEDPRAVSEMARAFRTAFETVGCQPHLDPALLREHYAEVDGDRPGTILGLVDRAFAAGASRNVTASLKHVFPSGWHTPKWRQFVKSNGHAIGCGPVAWAVVYGYWRAFKGKDKLFDGVDVKTMDRAKHSDDGKVRDCIWALAQYCDTKDRSYKKVKVGYTPPGQMKDGLKYARRYGYHRSTVRRHRSNEFDKFDEIRKELDADRPVILLLRDSGFGIPNHYVVIEAGSKRQRKIAGKWRNRDVKYLVNFCWGDREGNGRKWVYVREKGINDHKVHSATSAFLIDLL